MNKGLIKKGVDGQKHQDTQRISNTDFVNDPKDNLRIIEKEY